MPRKVTSPQLAAAPEGYGFTLRGSINPKADLSRKSPFTHFVLDLVRARNASRITPSQVAEQIAASPFARSFNPVVMTVWEIGLEGKGTVFKDWRFMPVSTSAESTIKYNGRNPGHDGLEWREGHLIPKPPSFDPDPDDERPIGNLFGQVAAAKAMPEGFPVTDWEGMPLGHDFPEADTP